MVWGNILALICLSCVIWATHMPLVLLFGLMFLFGFFTSSMLLAFALNKDRHAPVHNATVVAITNMVIMLLGAVYQPLIGVLLDVLMPSKVVGHYSALDYQHALIILPVTLCVTLALLCVIRVQKRAA